MQLEENGLAGLEEEKEGTVRSDTAVFSNHNLKVFLSKGIAKKPPK